MSTRILSLFLFVIIISCGIEQEKTEPLTEGNLTLSDATPNRGESLTITYSGKDSILISEYTISTEQDGVYEEETYDLNLDNEGNATINIPAETAMLAFNFLNEFYETDNNKGKGYIYMVYDDENNPIEYSKFLTTSYALNDRDVEETEKWESNFEDLMDSDSTLMEKFPIRYFSSYSALDKTDANDAFKSYAYGLLGNKDIKEADFQKVYDYAPRIRDKELTDSLKSYAVGKWPEGKVAVSNLFGEFRAKKSLEEREEYYLENKKQFAQDENTQNYIFRVLASMAMQEEDMDKFEEYTDEIGDPSTRASLYNSIAWDMAEAGENLEQAATYSKRSLDLLEMEIEKQNSRDKSISPREYSMRIENSQRMYYDTYAFILFQQDKLDEAIKYQKMALGPHPSEEIATRYAEFLTKAEKYDKIIEISEKVVVAGAAGDKFKLYLKDAYEKRNPEGDYDEFYAGLEDKALDKIKEEVDRKLIDEEPKAFTLKNMDGEEVSLASLKGKRVILDFWATWCGPCLMSFPGMQQVVDKYKDDDSVEILFVDTFEKGADRMEKINKVLSDNSYTFHVLIDEYREKEQNYLLADTYGVSGIPTKFVLDENGRIRYESVGFGGTEKLVKEIDVVLERIR